ncbi:hypothetical protein DFH08DRAFT_935033 [Mycena albidolilacea]|uniref:Uncharacterized protein n=1 Tax=Mycena albidolilacea TaxID=1033008 RepID=A0AAD7A886_9AGAR|nr:hypothetical protein DFH08DRAFT_935033 [Mycena albidolilacea]
MRCDEIRGLDCAPIQIYTPYLRPHARRTRIPHATPSSGRELQALHRWHLHRSSPHPVVLPSSPTAAGEGLPARAAAPHLPIHLDPIQILDSNRHTRARDPSRMAGAQASETGNGDDRVCRYECGESEQWEAENVDGRGGPAAEREGGAVIWKRDGRRRRGCGVGEGSIAAYVGNRHCPIAFVPPQLIPVIPRKRYAAAGGTRGSKWTQQRVSLSASSSCDAAAARPRSRPQARAAPARDDRGVLRYTADKDMDARRPRVSPSSVILAPAERHRASLPICNTLAEGELSGETWGGSLPQRETAVDVMEVACTEPRTGGAGDEGMRRRSTPTRTKRWTGSRGTLAWRRGVLAEERRPGRESEADGDKRQPWVNPNASFDPAVRGAGAHPSASHRHLPRPLQVEASSDSSSTAPIPHANASVWELPYLSTPAMCHSSLPTRSRTPSRQCGHCVLSTKSHPPNDAVRVAWGKRATRASGRWWEGARRGEQGGLTSLWAGGERGCRVEAHDDPKAGSETMTRWRRRGWRSQQRKGGANGVGVEAEDVSSI